MRKIIIAFFALSLIGLSEVSAQNYSNWAVGVKVGEPIALNIRKYFDAGTKNFDFNVGTYGLVWGGYREYRKSVYYDGRVGVMFQGIYHWNHQLGRNDALQAYYGFGGQINQRKTAPQVSNNKAEKHISLGGVGNTGLEYALPNSDNLSVFTDLGLYIEVAPKPLFTALNAAVGVRLNIIN